MKKQIVVGLALMSLMAFKCGRNNSAVVNPPPRPPQHNLLPSPSVTLIEEPVGFWNESLLLAIRSDRTAPPLAARAMAMLNLAMFDTINSVRPRYTSYRANIRLNPVANPVAGGATAAHRILISLYPRYKPVFDQQLAQFLSRIPESRAKSEGIFQGETIAHAMIDSRKADVVAVVTIPPPAPGPGVWRPTPPKHTEFLLSGWGKVLPFGLERGDQFRRSVNPPAFNSPAYLQAVEEVRLLGGRISLRRTPEQTLIANFWSDNAGTVTPPGHWIQIGNAVAKGPGDLLDRSRLFALLSMALADAGIACWDLKLNTYHWRPITAIRALHDGNWEPLLETPPFPDYVSGHSTFSGAASRMLSLIFRRDNVPFTIGSDDAPRVVRQYRGFSEAAIEAGRSRIFGGIHFEFANRDGIRVGNEVAETIFRNYLLPLK